MLRPTLALAMLLIAPVTADAAKVQDTFYNSVIPSRVDHLIGFAPTSFGIHPRDEPLRPLRVRVRGRTYRYLFSTASAVVAASPDIYLRNMIRQRRYPGLQGVFLDRRLTAAERRYMVVRADLGRDADVLAVASGHPACASGVSRAVARGIAKGAIRTWSAAGVPTPAGGDAIALRRAGDGFERASEPRFGAGYLAPKSARVTRDGGLSEAASGNQAIAAVTSWSRARSYGSSTCAVRVGGAAPDDTSVRALTHPDAYPISFVTMKRLYTRRNPLVLPITMAFVKFVAGPRGTSAFRERGMLLVKDAWAPVPGPQPEPERQPEPEATPPPELEFQPVTG
jgi:hypothetical protein